MKSFIAILVALIVTFVCYFILAALGLEISKFRYAVGFVAGFVFCITLFKLDYD